MSSSVKSEATIKASLRALGARVAKLRLSRNMPQASLAQEAGTSVSSVRRLEAGENTSLDTFMRVLGVLGLEQRLLESLPDPAVRPVERVQHGGRERQRARAPSDGVSRATDWAWGEEDEG